MFGGGRKVSGRLFQFSGLGCKISFKTSTFYHSAKLPTSHHCSYPVSPHSFLASLSDYSLFPLSAFQRTVQPASHFPLIRPDIICRYSSYFTHPAEEMDLKKVLDVLEQLAPLSLAEPWDNVGLLVEPSKPRPIKTILLTNDLTAAVMDEAATINCDLIISYHPPLFRPFKRLVQKDWKQKLAVRAIEGGIAVFSPHTSWDSIKGGINDWLVGGMGSGQVSVLRQAYSSAQDKHRLEFSLLNDGELDSVLTQLRCIQGSETFQLSTVKNEVGGQQVHLTCPSSALTAVVQTLVSNQHASKSLNVTQVQQPPLLGCGQGRLSVLDEPVSLAVAVQKMKTHLGLPHLRLALGDQQTLESLVKTVAVCAGSGGSVLQGVKADLYITGEMSHHEVLDAVAKGTSVILSDHSNSERGYLSVFKEKLLEKLGHAVSLVVSESDRDPLQVV
nr:NIF3-like protein 1 isoform X1 [Misgurnus anguillicaudatus]XP_055031430.1 NIF3-like protein 1 isoform X1 [Misgurnus anguillicaudatus]